MNVSAENIMLNGQTRRVLDTFVTDQGFFVLAKEGRTLILYMIERYSPDLCVI